MSWQALEDGNKELAEFGSKRFAANHVGYTSRGHKLRFLKSLKL